MYRILFKTSFVKQAQGLDDDQYRLLKKKLELLKHERNHHALKVHKLHGEFFDCYSFSLNYKMRVIFTFQADNLIVLIAVGDHSIYR